ncbi:uncharacterized protein LOC127851441 isoform X1 [Dreissena polymorpha]|uniref:Mab-21-like HhH/H2TH-like domain-containing protein n=1 Tax=Dreissena polymorpha TaxID=45954 RepID=A0A9D4I164_DREPO|nr:uncharacterized protein LOC127851441 isoform X1 [Dreissena polymorpha]XP_052241171.1 uncharacterized protein LOC127851441 isoform X2 [Dreissena polymorpha]XP_052241172.1 uncharacterized protein LOC127851441 isoform X1 [Dreissena polymorpha]XP_052241174.1 uncharacterized protein LOC127851441 isoform X1 [Dreissena polymorpha]KAH3740047.1 hypothetical protein DPMN_046742 [Dreissena polymorpha]
MQNPEHFTAMSIWLSKVLDDIGAGKETVMERKKTFLERECMATLFQTVCGSTAQYFHFGSQSEGTTIPGLQSDIDVLISSGKVKIMRVWVDWEAGMCNFLMLQDDMTPPQQYLLQVIKFYTPKPVMSLCDVMCDNCASVWDDRWARTDSGEVLMSAERFKQDLAYKYRDCELTKNGPSVSYIPNWDIVVAYIVPKPLPEIQHWIDRFMGRHWPPVQLLEAARIAPCFLVPSGHPDSDYKREEWRLSPNLIERMLMFSFNLTQIKCYIVLKLIKKSLFSKVVGDSITSYHCKTIMFFTLERTQPCLWCEHNLMFLLWLCLHELKNSLRFGRLPHYIIKGVNLFDGKLSKVQQRHLLVYIDSMISNNLQDIFCMGIDNIGSRLKACDVLRIGKTCELGRVCLRNSISLLLMFDCLSRFLASFTFYTEELVGSSFTTFEQDIMNKIRTCVEYPTNARLKTVPLRVIKRLFLLQISIRISNRLRLRNVLGSESIRRVQYSLNSDVASSHLKLASQLYCSGHFHAAVRVLEDVDRRYHNRVKAVCGHRILPDDQDIDTFANMISSHNDKVFSELPFAFCVSFFRQEMYCAPFILWFEMNRNTTAEEAAQRYYIEKEWMDCAEVDARTFLHYLQYLTYGGLGERDNQLHTLRVFECFINDIRNHSKIHHAETAINLLGHCYEMEGDYERALQYYELSLHCLGTNNAANWHVRRVLRLING